MVGRDHRVLVLEVAGEEDREPSQPQPNKLPAVCEWLFASWSSWFRTQPQLMYARFWLAARMVQRTNALSCLWHRLFAFVTDNISPCMSEFLKCCRPYSQECSLRKVHMRIISRAFVPCPCLASQILADILAEHLGCLPQHRLQASCERACFELYWQSLWSLFTNARICLNE
jgi:hypothetical protein